MSTVAAMDSPGDVDAFIYELPSPCLASLHTVTTVSSSYSSNEGLSSLREKGTDQAKSFSQKGDSDHPYIHTPLQSPSHEVALRARLLTYPVQHPSNVKK